MHRFERWRNALQVAHTEADVQNAMADYVRALGATIAALPSDAQTALMEQDIQSAAVTLLMVEMRHNGTDGVGELLHEIAHTYAAASVRLTKIKREPLTPAQ